MMRIMVKYLLLVVLLIHTALPSLALVQIDINQGNIEPMPIALPYFGGLDRDSKKIGRDVIEVVQKDLERSGLFHSISRRAFLQTIDSSETLPNFNDWRQVNASALLAGGINVLDGEKFKVQFRLWDVFSEEYIEGQSYTTHRDNWRRIAHMTADRVYSRLTGEKGYFDSRIVYVSETGSALKRKKRLAIMDQDGANHRFLTDGSDLVLTPRFSPNSQEVIYLSYADGKPRVYILNVDSGERRLLGNFPGMSFAPRFSPDGKSVVMSVSNDGNTDIYTMNLKSKVTRQLTSTRGIDTSPSYSPDGKYIVFNSDRGGSQQLYVMRANGKNVKRISFSKNGRYGTPVWSPRGDLIAFTKMYKGKFFIGVMRPDGSGERLLTESYLDEGPTWSPNGRVIIFARQGRHFLGKPGSWSIWSVDLTGYNERKLKTPKGASDPAWSPLL